MPAPQGNDGSTTTVTSTCLLAGLRKPENRTVWQQFVDRYRPMLVRYGCHSFGLGLAGCRGRSSIDAGGLLSGLSGRAATTERRDDSASGCLALPLGSFGMQFERPGGGRRSRRPTRLMEPGLRTGFRMTPILKANGKSNGAARFIRSALNRSGCRLTPRLWLRSISSPGRACRLGMLRRSSAPRRTLSIWPSTASSGGSGTCSPS